MMESSLAERSGAAGRTARRLLLALALAACGGGDDGAAAKAGDQDTSGVAVSAQDAGCTPPPTVDSALFKGTWVALRAELVRHNVTYRNTDTIHTVARMPLCRGCDSTRIRIVSEARTYCTRADSLRGRPRLSGAYVVLDSVRAFEHQFVPGDSLLLFARDTTALLAYDQDGNVALAPELSWKFHFCQDGKQHTSPQGRWRPYSTGSRSGSDSTGNGEGQLEGGTYGWMACASGCCQFYIPPPGPAPDPVDSTRVGGSAPQTPPCPDLAP